MTYILKQNRPVLMRVGYFVTTEAGYEPLRIELKFSDNDAVDVPLEYHEFLQFMQIPRLDLEVFVWLDEHGMGRSVMKQLLRKGWLLEVRPGSLPKALATFKGIRIVPTCYIQKQSEKFDDFHYVTNEEHAPFIERVSPLLGAAMWDSLEGEDLPSSANRVAMPGAHRLSPPTAYTADQKAAMSLSNLHMLLTNNFVRLERVTPLEQTEGTKTSWLASLFGKKK